MLDGAIVTAGDPATDLGAISFHGRPLGRVPGETARLTLRKRW